MDDASGRLLGDISNDDNFFQCHTLLYSSSILRQLGLQLSNDILVAFRFVLRHNSETPLASFLI